MRNLFSNNSMKPADIFIQNWTDDGKDAAIDVSTGITSVKKKSIIEQSQTRLLAVAKSFYSHKNNKHNEYITDNDINMNSNVYIPIITENFGGFHKVSVNFIKKMGNLRAANMSISKSQSISHCFTKISASFIVLCFR